MRHEPTNTGYVVPTPVQRKIAARLQPARASASPGLGATLTAPLGTPSEPVEYAGKPITVRSSTVRVLRTLIRTLTYFLLFGGSVIYAIPFIYMVRWSLMTTSQVYDPDLFWPLPMAWENYTYVLEHHPVPWWLLNSSIVTFIAVTVGTFVCCLVAYGFARLDFPGKRVLFMVLLSTMMLPLHVTIIPLVIIFRELGWIDTLWPLIVPGLGGSAFLIFILRQFFMTIPIELDEAARTDGASRAGILFRVILPLSKPAIATVAVFSFIGTWNDFFLPLIILNSAERITLPVGLRYFAAGQYSEQLHTLQMAVAMISVLPIVVIFFFAQRHFVRGITLTGIKG